MSIYKQGIERGLEQGIERGLELGILRGKQEDILELLQELGPVGENLKLKIMGETDKEILKVWHKLASRAGSIEEFEAQLGS